MANPSSNQNLINEAIERILLDIVIRGHGERLIGRWSGEPSIQIFLERVPYLLDRINQLHLICTRSGLASDTADQRHHLHSHHHHHHQHGHRRVGPSSHSADEQQGCLHDFVNLIGSDQHWLVRTRDSLGLTPLHKAVLFNNRPIVEFILDRYPDELAVVGLGQSKQAARRPGGDQRHNRLIDAQDKYGRTALHYAAALVSARSQHANRAQDPDEDEIEHEHSRQLSVFKFLLAKGANRRLRDFRGKTADFYARHGDQLRVKSIIHLANKLNANYQAAVLSRTLKALTFRGQRIEGEDYIQGGEPTQPFNEQAAGSFEPPSENRESMSISCSDLHEEERQSASSRRARSRSSTNLHAAEPTEDDPSQLLMRPHAANGGRAGDDFQLSASDNWTSSSLCSSTEAPPQFRNSSGDHSGELAKLQADRVERPVLDERTKTRVKKCLIDGKLEEINELMIDGLGTLLVEQARISCWNSACKRYIANVIPNLLKQLDSLHELVATNQLLALKTLVTREPILARIKRPYKRASMNALHLAAHWNRKSMVNFLVERQPELVSRTDSHGATCLHWAARSLHSDRLYTWLADHFGAQLEQVRDRRGKTAANYRQQAIRLASFECQSAGEERRPADESSRSRRQRRGPQSDAERILDRTQMQADELQASGVRSQLMRRSADVQQGVGHKYRPVRVVEPHRVRAEPGRRATPPAPIKLDDKRDECAQVSIGIESASSIELSEEALEESRDSSHQNCHKPRPASGHGSSVNAHITNGTWRSERSMPEHFGDQTNVPITEPTTNASGPADFFSEFGQLEDDLVGGTVYQAGTPGANGATRPLQDRATEIVRAPANDDAGGDCLPDSRASASSRANEPPGDANRIPDQDIERKHSATLRDKNLDQIIGDCIASGQFKKLEHLILAGCGRRVEEVYRFMRAADGSPRARLSREMVAFLEGRAIDFTQICEQIHRQIHQCHSLVLLHSQLADSNKLLTLGEPSKEEHELSCAHRIQLDSARGELCEADHSLSSETLNSSFHKLSSLLQDNAFLMARDKYGASPLHVALIRADGRLLEYLLHRQPNVASAPDHDNRTSIHYAAIVLAAFESHGPVKVTNLPARAYWQVDETARQVYGNLCARFGHELAALRDRKGKIGRDYLSQKVDAPKHPRLDKLPRGLYKPEVIANCCPEYARMLQRYDYLILVAGDHEDESAREVLGSGKESHSEPGNQTQSTLVRMHKKHSSFECSRSLRYSQSKKKEANGSTSSEPATSRPAERGTLLVGHQLGPSVELVVPNPPSLHSPLESPTMLARRQVAPKPVVGGCDLSFAAGAPATEIAHVDPDVRVRGELASKQSLALTNQQQQTQAKRLNYSPLASAVVDTDGRSLDASPAIISLPAREIGAKQYCSPIDDQHWRNKSKRGHHAHHSRRSDSSKRHASRNKAGRLSVVGGVIVPTIIHNDKMDEIETYDIIYRQPPSKCNSESSSSSTGSRSGSNSSLNSSLLSLDELDTRHTGPSAKHLLPSRPSKLSKSPSVSPTRSAVSPMPNAAARHKPNKSAKFGNLNGELAANCGLVSEAPMASFVPAGTANEEEDENNDDDDEDHEEDDRVERLSNEFEERVRREKGELRQKVDQIMREIKSSAKSGKSSRFLASPSDLGALNEQPPPSTQQLALAVPKKEQASSQGARDNKSLTSSGESKRSSEGSSSLSSATCSNSRCNSSSSSSSNLSAGIAHDRTSSCSSSSSSGSTISSVSSPTTSIGGGREKSRKTVTINEPRRLGHAQVNSVNRTATFSSAVGALNQHLCELTDHLASKNSYGQTYLHFIASKSQSSSTLYKVLEHGKHLIGERDVFYRTARDVALQFNLTTNVQVLDKYVIDLFIGGHTQLLWLLLNQGYSPLIHVSDPDGNDIMLILKLLKQERTISYLLQMADFQRWRDELHTFIRHGYSAGVSELIKKHKDLVRAKSAYSRTSLHLAVLFDRLEMIGELIAMDPSCVQAIDNMGRTPLHYVYGLQLKNGEEIRSELMARGASLETRDVRERTPKYYYIFRREIEDIRRIELELN